SLQGRPSFADEVNQLTDPVDAAWVRKFLTWFPRFREVPPWYIDGRVQDGTRMPSHVWRETLAGLVSARPPPHAATVPPPHPALTWRRPREVCPPGEPRGPAAAPPRGRGLVVSPDPEPLLLGDQPEGVPSAVPASAATPRHRPASPGTKTLP